MPREVVLAVVIGVHGLKGAVKVKHFTERPESLAQYGALHAGNGARFDVLSVMPGKAGTAALFLKGVADRAAAEALKGCELRVARDALPEVGTDEFYHADLIGLAAEDGHGRVIGTLSAIHNYGAGDVLEITRADGDTLLIAFTRENTPTIDPGAGRIVIAVPPEIESDPRGFVE
jgi:16S rRNA processing protein RimM